MLGRTFDSKTVMARCKAATEAFGNWPGLCRYQPEFCSNSEAKSQIIGVKCRAFHRAKTESLETKSRPPSSLISLVVSTQIQKIGIIRSLKPSCVSCLRPRVERPDHGHEIVFQTVDLPTSETPQLCSCPLATKCHKNHGFWHPESWVVHDILQNKIKSEFSVRRRWPVWELNFAPSLLVDADWFW